jgi:hypothetical protein
VSATTLVNDVGTYTWSSAQVAADVQDMLSNPANNFGWVLKSPETAIGDSKRFASRQEPIVTSRPRLEVTYVAPPSASVTNLGLGCGPSLAATGVPAVGNPGFALTISGGAPGAYGYVFAANALDGSPYDLGGGCTFALDLASATNYYLSGVFLGPLPLNGAGQVTFPAPIPPTAFVHGLSILVEGVVFGASTTATNVLSLLVGT